MVYFFGIIEILTSFLHRHLVDRLRPVLCYFSSVEIASEFSWPASRQLALIENGVRGKSQKELLLFHLPPIHVLPTFARLSLTSCSEATRPSPFGTYCMLVSTL